MPQIARVSRALQPSKSRRHAVARIGLSLGASFALVSGMAGCGMFGPKPPPPPPPPKPPPPPAKLSIRLSAASKLNPDARERSTPVVVRIYELKSAAAFTSASFMALFDQDRSTLGGDLVAREEFVMQPGGLKAIDRLLDAETQAIGVMVAYRDLERARWRKVVALDTGMDNAVTVGLEDVGIDTSSRASKVPEPPPAPAAK